MRQRIRTTFEHPYEAVKWAADQNYMHFCEEAALRLYREALALARSEQEKLDCQHGISLCSERINPSC